jgi:hypothetical protein
MTWSTAPAGPAPPCVATIAQPPERVGAHSSKHRSTLESLHALVMSLGYMRSSTGNIRKVLSLQSQLPAA